MYKVFEGTSEDTDSDTVTTITPITGVAAMTATTAGTMGTAQPSMMSTVNAKIAPAINQLSANQMAIMTQMAALSFMPPPANPTTRYRAIANIPRSNNSRSRSSSSFPPGISAPAGADDAEVADVGAVMEDVDVPHSRTTSERKVAPV